MTGATAPSDPADELPVADVRAAGPLHLGALSLPPWCARRTVTIEVGAAITPATTSWDDEIVSVEAGTIELESPNGDLV